MKVKDVTFAHAVRLQNKKLENFVTSTGTLFTLEYDVKSQLLSIQYKDSAIVKKVGITNIIEMTVELE